MDEDDDNKATVPKQSNPCVCKRSRIPVKSDSKTDTKKPTTKIVSRIPIPLTSSSTSTNSYKLKIKVRSSTNNDCKCVNDGGEEEEENAAPKICKICDCDSGICNPECLQAKKERIKKFMSRAIQRKTSNLDEAKNTENKDEDVPVTTADESNTNSMDNNKISEDNNNISEDNNNIIEDNKKKKKVCEICKCTKPCNSDCEAKKKEKEVVKNGKICEVCKCKKPCNKDCEANKKILEAKSTQKRICEICKCKKPCNDDCEANKKKLAENEICEICKCTKPCRDDCEAKKKQLDVNKICEYCKCTKPCNPDCEGNKKKIEGSKVEICEICKCTKPCKDDCEAKKKEVEEMKTVENKICEVCKCTKPCNPDCEANKKVDEICEICKCTKPCRNDCEAKKKQPEKDTDNRASKDYDVNEKKVDETGKISENKEYEEKSDENKICEICKCLQPCNNDCEANKQKTEEVKKIENPVCKVCNCLLPCNDDCEDNKKKIALMDQICEICKCTMACNEKCEEEQKRKKEDSEAKKKQIDEICNCLEESVNRIESKHETAIKVSTSIVAKNEVCAECKCTQTCNDECEEKKKLDAENKPALYSEVQKSLEGKACDVCVCTDVCNDECLEKMSKERTQKMDRSASKLEVIVEEKLEIDVSECGESINTEAPEEVIGNELQVKSDTCVDAELTDDENKQKVCEVCKCSLDACHAICAEIKKLREDINKPPNLTACIECQCSPNPCNEVCVMTMSKTVETNISVRTSTPTSLSADYGCGTDDEPTKPEAKRPSCEIPSLISELSSVMSDIKCSCKKAESISKKSKRCRQTESDMRLVIQHLQQKCKMKDIFIDAMISDLSERNTSRVFDSLLCKIASNTKSVCDFDRVAIANALPRPVNGVRPLKSRKTGDCICEEEFKIIVVKRIGPSLLIRWTASQDLSVIGYHVFVDGKVRGKVFHRLRTSVLLDCLDLRKDLRIEVYAMTKDGRNEPPAVSVYSTCPC